MQYRGPAPSQQPDSSRPKALAKQPLPVPPAWLLDCWPFIGCGALGLINPTWSSSPREATVATTCCHLHPSVRPMFCFFLVNHHWSLFVLTVQDDCLEGVLYDGLHWRCRLRSTPSTRSCTDAGYLDPLPPGGTGGSQQRIHVEQLPLPTSWAIWSRTPTSPRRTSFTTTK